jgi:site-specific DNA recombinase
LNGLNTLDSEYKGLIEHVFNHLDNFKQTDTERNIKGKSTLVSLIFPESLQFDGKKCRTPRINDVLRCIFHIDIYLPKNKKGQMSNYF